MDRFERFLNCYPNEDKREMVALLEDVLAERDRAILEMNHRVGNMAQIAESSLRAAQTNRPLAERIYGQALVRIGLLGGEYRSLSGEMAEVVELKRAVRG